MGQLPRQTLKGGLTLPYLQGLPGEQLLNWPLSTEAVLKVDPMCIPERELLRSSPGSYPNSLK